ncbi:VanZ family protein [Candidatus Kryptobacter tengchongensis]|uniref:VanZ family protein n=1 Tax=Kryptobacter tengchongensis TaxID=1643429 RepID=UPI002FDECE98
MKNFLKYQFPAFAWMGIIFILSSIPGNYFPEQPFDLFDKLVHACLFGILTYLIYRGFQYQDKSAFFKNFSIAIAFLICVIYGIIDELHQEYIPGRSPDITDALADILGGGFVSLYLLFFNYRKTKRR